MKKIVLVVVIMLSGFVLSACGGATIDANSSSYSNGYEHGYGGNGEQSTWCVFSQYWVSGDNQTDWEAGCAQGWADVHK